MSFSAAADRRRAFSDSDLLRPGRVALSVLSLYATWTKISAACSVDHVGSVQSRLGWTIHARSPRATLTPRSFVCAAVYSIFTSPHHPPVPDHLPTLIVTPNGRPNQVLCERASELGESRTGGEDPRFSSLCLSADC